VRRHRLQGRVLDEFRGGQTRRADRYNLIVVTVNDQRRHIELLEILGKIRLGERFDAIQGVLMTACIPCSQNQSIIPCEIFAPAG